MATGRTVDKWTRVYINGYDMSGYARSIGPLGVVFDEADLTAMSNQVKGYLPNHAEVNAGTLNTVFDNTATSGVHTVLNQAGSGLYVLVAKGIRGEPAEGDPAFGGVFLTQQYGVVEEGGAMTVTIPFSGWYEQAGTTLYASPWGQLLHENSAETGANSGTGLDNPTGAATAKGGIFMYQITGYAGTGSATISVDDSANNSDFLALSGATSGEIAHTAMPAYGLVALGNAADVRRYLRFQVAITDLTSVTFASAFMRAY